jgi:hypothetical protein
MQLLKDEWDEAGIIAELLPALPGYRPQKCLQSSGGLLVHPEGQFYFITSCISVFRQQLRRSRQQLSACTMFLWRQSPAGIHYSLKLYLYYFVFACSL